MRELGTNRDVKEITEMKIFGKTIPEYVSFAKGILILALVVGLARLVLSLAGVANSADRFLSLTAVMLIGLLYFSVRVHTTGFGSYLQLLPVLALQWIVSQCIIIAGIMIAITTSKDNIFSAPEFSPNKIDGRNWGHAAAHLVVMVTLPLISWLIGCLIMFITKKIAGGGEHKVKAAGA
jgi:hypothetical protein